MRRFDVCLAETLRWEGGYSDHPLDPGGKTMCGVIQRVYDGWRDQMGLARRHVRDIERREIEAIYRQNYWAAVRGDELPEGVNLVVFDFGVNSGPPRAVMALQRIVGVAPDGHIGSATLAAVRARDASDLVMAMMAERRRFLRQIKTFETFGKGWLRRCDGVEDAANELCEHGTASGWTPVPPLADADAQSETQGRATLPPPPQSVAETKTGGVQTAQVALGSGVTLTQGMELAERMERLGFVQTLVQSPMTLALIACGLVIAAGGVWQLRDRAQKLILGV